MGLFGRIASAVGSGVRKIGTFGGMALSKIGQVKHLYDRINNATGGIIGETLERLPVVGPALKHVGSFLNDHGRLTTLSNGFRSTSVLGKAIDKFGND